MASASDLSPASVSGDGSCDEQDSGDDEQDLGAFDEESTEEQDHGEQDEDERENHRWLRFRAKGNPQVSDHAGYLAIETLLPLADTVSNVTDSYPALTVLGALNMAVTRASRSGPRHHAIPQDRHSTALTL